MHLHPKRQLLDVIRTLRSPRRLTRRLHGRQQQGDEHANNGDYDQKLDKRKCRPEATN
jgi:hypothetical protein